MHRADYFLITVLLALGFIATFAFSPRQQREHFDAYLIYGGAEWNLSLPCSDEANGFQEDKDGRYWGWENSASCRFLPDGPIKEPEQIQPVVQQPAQIAPQPAQIAPQPAKVVPQPAQIAPQPAKVVPQPAPAKVVPQPAKSDLQQAVETNDWDKVYKVTCFNSIETKIKEDGENYSVTDVGVPTLSRTYEDMIDKPKTKLDGSALTAVQREYILGHRFNQWFPGDKAQDRRTWVPTPEDTKNEKEFADYVISLIEYVWDACESNEDWKRDPCWLIVKEKWPSAVVYMDNQKPNQGFMAAFSWTGWFGWYTIGIGPNENWHERRMDTVIGVAHELAHATRSGHEKTWRTVMIFLMNVLATRYTLYVPCETCIGVGFCDKLLCPKCKWEMDNAKSICDCPVFYGGEVKPVKQWLEEGTKVWKGKDGVS